MSLTPKQFNQLATKKDLEALVDRFVEEDLFNKRMDGLLTAIDGLTKKVGDYEAEQASNIVAHGRMQEMIDKLVVKVKKLEKQKAL